MVGDALPVSDRPLREVYAVALAAARAGAQVVRQGLGRVGRPREKEAHHLVTEWDQRSEAAIVGVIRQHYPDDAILAEEGTRGGPDQAHRWIVDPLDGTTNFSHGYPVFCVAVAYEERGRLLVSAVVNPVLRETFSAIAGRGAWLNGRRLRVSTVASLAGALVATGFPYEEEWLAMALRQWELVSYRAQGVRRDGAAALDLCYVAAGRFDAYWQVYLSPWDMAASVLIVREAGGQVTDLQGGSFSLERREVLATNGLLHPEMVAVLRAASTPVGRG